MFGWSNHRIRLVARKSGIHELQMEVLGDRRQIRPFFDTTYIDSNVSKSFWKVAKNPNVRLGAHYGDELYKLRQPGNYKE